MSYRHRAGRLDQELPRYWGEPDRATETQTVALVNIARSLEKIALIAEDFANAALTSDGELRKP